MRHLRRNLSFLPVLLYLTACTRTSESQNPPGNANKWDLVSDSSYEGVGLGNHPVDYTGKTGDYFAFSTDGHVYTKEGSTLDTLTYQQLSDSTVIISHFGVIFNGIPDTSKITGLTGSIDSGHTAETIAIESPFGITPDGLFWRKVTLNR